MRKESQHEDATAAAADGYTGSAKAMGSAAIIMISVLASFIFSPDPATRLYCEPITLGSRWPGSWPPA